MFNEVLQGSAIYQAQDPQVISDYVNQHIGTHRISVKGECERKASIWHRNFSDVALSRIPMVVMSEYSLRIWKISIICR